MDLNTIIGTGSQSTVYYSNNYAIKMFNENYNKTSIFYEAFLNTLLEQINIPIPKIHEILILDNRFALKMDYIPGISLIDCIYNDMDNFIIYLNKMIDIQIQLHSITIKLPISFKSNLKNKILSTELIDSTTKNSLLNSLDNLSDGNKLCHGDFHGYNILVSDNTYWIIDWIDATFGSPEGDVCRTYMIYSLYVPELAEIYLKIYCEKTQIKTVDIIKWLPVIAAARLSENIACEKDQLITWINDFNKDI